jgi:hypothetical protein
LNPSSLQGGEWLRQRVFAAALSPCLQTKTSIDLFADSRGNIPDEGLNMKNSRPCRIRNVGKQARQKTLARKILTLNPSLQIFNKTKCANLVSNVADATD